MISGSPGCPAGGPPQWHLASLSLSPNNSWVILWQSQEINLLSQTQFSPFWTTQHSSSLLALHYFVPDLLAYIFQINLCFFFLFLTTFHLLCTIPSITRVSAIKLMCYLDLTSLPCQILHDLAMNKMKQTGASFANDLTLTLENNAPVHTNGNSTVSKDSPSGSSREQSMQNIFK